MAQPRSNKRERERQRVEKAAAKAERRTLRLAGDGSVPETSAVDQEQVLARLAELHRRYDDEEVTLDDFLEQKAELTAQLVVPDS